MATTTRLKPSKTAGELPIGVIRVGTRSRKDLGDLDSLARSISEIGLLHAVVVSPDNRLIAGFRRLQACKRLGWKTIPVRVVDLDRIVEGEFAENACRKDFTLSEVAAIAKKLRPVVEARARQRQVACLKQGNGAPVGQNAHDGETGKSRDVIARYVGVSGTTLEKVEAIVQAAEENPEKYGHLKERMDDTGKVNHCFQQLRFAQVTEQQALAQGAKHHKWTVTANQKVVPCDLLIADQPYGITDEPWEPSDLESFTRDWASRWSSCDADFIAVFFSQQHMWNGRKWLDESLKGFEFQQMLVWHAPNNMAPKSRACFKQTWEPIFLYRRSGSERLVHDEGSWWTGELHDFDCHIAPVPERDFGGHDFKQHPCQKPVSAMKWLINALTKSGEKVVSLFSGVSPCGVAALQLGRQYHGIEIDKKYASIAEKRLAAFGTPDRPKTSVKTVRPNTVVQGDCLDLIPLLPDQSVNLVVTSPMYAEQRKGFYRSVPERLYPEFTLRWMSALWDKLTDDGSVLIVLDPNVESGEMAEYVLQTQLVLRDFGWKQHRTQIWYKPDMLPLGHKWWPRHVYESILWFSKSNKPFCDPWACGSPSGNLAVNGYSWSEWSPGGKPVKEGIARTTDVIVVPVGTNEEGIDHPAVFPVGLAEILAKTFCPPKGSVLDNFCGSGSTLLGVKRTGEGRTFYGFDIEPKYVELARQRLAEMNGHQSPPRKSPRQDNGRNGDTNHSGNGRHVARRAK